MLFICKVADYVTRNVAVEFREVNGMKQHLNDNFQFTIAYSIKENISYFRQRMLVEVATGRFISGSPGAANIRMSRMKERYLLTAVEADKAALAQKREPLFTFDSWNGYLAAEFL